MASTQLKRDAINRMVRTLYQGVGIDILVGIGIALASWVGKDNFLTAEAGLVLVYSVIKSAVQAIASYLMRLKLDSSKVPTPEPPVNPAIPEDRAA